MQQIDRFMQQTILFMQQELKMKTLYYNPATKIIFASEDSQDASIQTITPDAVPDLIGNGATVDSSANDLTTLGKSDLSVGGSTPLTGAAPDAQVKDASVNGLGTAGEQGNVLPVGSSAGASGMTQTDPSSGNEAGNTSAAAASSPNATAASNAGSEQQAAQLGEAGQANGPLVAGTANEPGNVLSGGTSNIPQPPAGTEGAQTPLVPEDPNADALRAVDLPGSATSSSASNVSPGVVTQAQDDAAVSVGERIRESTARIRKFLWTFEHSAVAGLHAELDKLENLI